MIIFQGTPKYVSVFEQKLQILRNYGDVKTQNLHHLAYNSGCIIYTVISFTGTKICTSETSQAPKSGHLILHNF